MTDLMAPDNFKEACAIDPRDPLPTPETRAVPDPLGQVDKKTMFRKRGQN